MIFLPCDEAFALDYFAILLVKKQNGLPVKPEIRRLVSHLSTQIPNFGEVFSSPEFNALIAANRSTFDAVAAAGDTSVQKANYSRYLAKQALQKKFWPGEKLMELKRENGL